MRRYKSSENVARFSEYSFMNIHTKLEIGKILYLTVA